MKVEVFQKDIDQGQRGDCHRCVLANAIARLPFPEGAKFVSVSYKDFCYEDEDNNTISEYYKFPREVGRYARRFDKNPKSVLPTVFKINVPV